MKYILIILVSYLSSLTRYFFRETLGTDEQWIYFVSGVIFPLFVYLTFNYILVAKNSITRKDLLIIGVSLSALHFMTTFCATGPTINLQVTFCIIGLYFYLSICNIDNHVDNKRQKLISLWKRDLKSISLVFVLSTVVFYLNTVRPNVHSDDSSASNNDKVGFAYSTSTGQNTNNVLPEVPLISGTKFTYSETDKNELKVIKYRFSGKSQKEKGEVGALVVTFLGEGSPGPLIIHGKSRFDDSIIPYWWDLHCNFNGENQAGSCAIIDTRQNSCNKNPGAVQFKYSRINLSSSFNLTISSEYEFELHFEARTKVTHKNAEQIELSVPYLFPAGCYDFICTVLE